MRRCILALLIVLGCFGVIQPSSAASDPLIFQPEIQIPNLPAQITISPTSIADYIRAIFVVFIWSVGVLGVVMVIYGGVKWVAAAGNAARINDARDVINNAIIGVIIALTSVVLLNIINPNLTNFAGLDIQPIAGLPDKVLPQIIAAVGDITPCAGVQASHGTAKACTQQPICIDVNRAVNDSGAKYGLEPVGLKALMQQENRAQGDSFISRASVTKKGSPVDSSYGIGQMENDAVYEALVAMGEDQSWKGNCLAKDPGRPGGRMKQSCQDWMDGKLPGQDPATQLKVQVDMMAAYLNILANSKSINNVTCVGNSVAALALAYHLGGVGASKFCQDRLTVAQKNDGQNYLASFKKYYQQICDQSQTAAGTETVGHNT